jgi:hypothetical protein
MCSEMELSVSLWVVFRPMEDDKKASPPLVFVCSGGYIGISFLGFRMRER